MSRFEDLMEPLTADAQRTLLALLAALQDPEHTMSRDEFLEAATRLIAGSRSRARIIALALVQETVEEALGSPFMLSRASVSAAVESGADVATLAGVLAGVLDDEDPQETTSMRLARLARAEPLFAAQEVTQSAIVAEPAITGWVRDLEGDACQLCRWWWREGRVWAPDHRMPTHKGCSCSQRPVTIQP